MKISRAILILFVFFTSLIPAAHAARLPEPKTVQAEALSFFKKYGKKYSGTIFSENVSGATVHSIQESSFKSVFADILVEHGDGSTTRVILKLENKFPKGWHIVSWEIYKPEESQAPSFY